MQSLLVGLAFIVIYLLPGLAAVARGHSKSWTIVKLNVFLGWTLMGWVAALVMALGHDYGDRRR